MDLLALKTAPTAMFTEFRTDLAETADGRAEDYSDLTAPFAVFAASTALWMAPIAFWMGCSGDQVLLARSKETVMNRYLCLEKVVTCLENANLSLNALRLTHACLALTEWHPSRTLGAMWLKPDLGYRVRCVDVAATAFPPSLKDHGPIRQAINELMTATNLFDHLEIDATGRLLTYRFGRPILKIEWERAKKDAFVLLAPAEFGTFRSSRHAMFFTRVELARNMNQPKFFIPGLDQPDKSWQATARLWRDAASIVASRTGDSYMFSPRFKRFSNTIADVAVKFSTPNSNWAPGALYTRHDRDLPTIVDATGHRKLTRAEFRARMNWTSVGELPRSTPVTA